MIKITPDFLYFWRAGQLSNVRGEESLHPPLLRGVKRFAFLAPLRKGGRGDSYVGLEFPQEINS
jgi:hypothetical protein